MSLAHRVDKFWFKSIVRHDYDWKQLEKINSYRKASFEYLIKYLENYPEDLTTFLDVGCWDTYNIELAERWWFNAKGIDLYPAVESDKIIKGDFYKMWDKFNYQDIIFCNHTLEHADSVYNLMYNMSKLQKKWGILFIAVPDWESERAYSLYQSTTHYSILTYGFLLTTMQRFGYNVIPCRKELREWKPELRFIWIKQ